MQDARNLVVAILAGCGNEKEITKHLKAWSQGRQVGAKPSKRDILVTEQEMEKMRKLREQVDKRKAAET